MEVKYTGRKVIIMASIALLGLVYLIRLFYVQVINDEYKLSAENNVLRHITEYPARGLIYDRHGELLVYNEAYYDLMVIPKQVKKLDTLDFCQTLGIEREDFEKRMDKIKAYSRFKPSVFEKLIPSEEFASIQEKLHKFKGFYPQTRTLRKYPDPMAAHLLGYISEVDERTVEKSDYYKMGDYIGQSGIEQEYEKYLRGEKGEKVVMVDVHNRIKGSFQGGEYDRHAVAGKNLITTIDKKLQAYGERLMQNKSGSIVAIEPNTGEVLALVNSPSYNPNLLVGRVRSKNFELLLADTLKPLFNRALMSSQNPPGSTFKTLNALIGLQEDVVAPTTTYPCHGGYVSGSFRMGCHAHRSPLNLQESVQHSCNAYYGNLFRKIIDSKETVREGFDVWRSHVMSFGLGKKLGIDLPNELGGNVPEGDYYDRYYGEDRWKSLTIISLAIGQGEMGTTPLQLANMTAAIANRGYYYTPHVVKEIEGEPQVIDSLFTRHKTTIDRQHFDLVVNGMEDVVLAGTGRRSKITHISMCGKTGTAQNPHGEDHSIFIAFAPKDDPQIALCVFVENAGGGSAYAAPISSLMVEKYLTDSISRPRFELAMLEADLIHKKEEKLAEE